MKQMLKNTWQFSLAACVLLFIACAQLPLSEPGTDTSSVTGEPAANTTGTVSSQEPVLPVEPGQPAAEASTDTLVLVSEQGSSIQPDVESGYVPEIPAAGIQPENAAQPIVSLPGPLTDLPPDQPEVVINLCKQIGNKLGSVSEPDCQKHGFHTSGGMSVNGRPLVIKQIAPSQPGPQPFKVLIMGGIHGDEYSSISILFKWLDLFSTQGLESEFTWRFVPLVNPDGLLDGKAKRQNANGVDLNRNFPSQDWSASAVAYWQESTGSNPRRFPGANAGSEPEVRWLVSQIEDFQPDVIVSVHAPYHLLDFDGPADAPDRIGELYLHQLGVYPGSLGNYAGLNKRIPVVTLELPSAGIMPPQEQISLMWRDLVAWLDREGRKEIRN